MHNGAIGARGGSGGGGRTGSSLWYLAALLAAVCVSIAYDNIYGLGYAAAALGGVQQQSPLDLGVVEQPLLDRNVGIVETPDGIRANHQVLKVFDRPWKTYKLLETLPHNRSHFTQGLYFHDGQLYEGTGLHGQSVLAKVDPPSGRTLEMIHLPPKYFGEGCARTRTRIVQLTYKHQRGFLYDASAPTGIFVRAGDFEYATRTGQGWGIAYDAAKNELVVSDGSSYLFFWDADTLKEKRYVQVKIVPRKSGAWQPLEYINELEVLPDGRILANVWYADVIVAIEPASGEVTDIYDFQSLHTTRSRFEDCFNGIALDAEKGELYVTGKKWPNMYKVSLVDD